MKKIIGKCAIVAAALTMCMPLNALASTATVTLSTNAPTISTISVKPILVKNEGVITVAYSRYCTAPQLYMRTAEGQIKLANNKLTGELTKLGGKIVDVVGYYNVAYKADGTPAPTFAPPDFVVTSYTVPANQITLSGKIVVAPQVVYKPLLSTTSTSITATPDMAIAPYETDVYLQTGTTRIKLTGDRATLAVLTKANGKYVSIHGIQTPVMISPYAKLNQLKVVTYDFLNTITIR